MDVNKKIEELKLVPVVVLQDAKDAVPLAKALIAGGLPVAEVTFRTAAAADSIKAISEACPEMLVGAGTVTNLEQAKKAKEAGAKFIVTPGFSKTVTEFAVENNIPVFPGVCTPTEIMMVMEYNLPVVEFLPGISVRRTGYHQGTFRPVPVLKIHAHRRCKRRQRKGVSGKPEDHRLRRQLDGKREPDQGRQI